MPINERVGYPFGCSALVKIDESTHSGKCEICYAAVHSTTSRGRLKILDNFFANGGILAEVSQVVDYSCRKKIPKGNDGAVIFAVRCLG